MQHCKIIGIGHPRTGTGYTSKLLSAWGLDIGHERVKRDGIIAWQLIVNTEKYPFISLHERPEYDTLIYCVRNPYFSIPSIVYTENTKRKSLNFRKKYLGLHERQNPIETAIESLHCYNKIATAFNPITYRIEYDQEKLFNKISEKYPVYWSEYNEIYNKRSHNNFDSLNHTYGKISKKHLSKINNLCRQWGYEKIFK